MDTPKDSDQTTIHGESKMISSIEIKSDNSQETQTKVYKPKYIKSSLIESKESNDEKLNISEYVQEATFSKLPSNYNYDFNDSNINFYKNNNVFDYSRHNFDDTLKIGSDSREITEFKIEEETIEMPSQSLLEDTCNPNISPSPKANEPYIK